jgi:ATP-binding cassette subfamily B protein
VTGDSVAAQGVAPTRRKREAAVRQSSNGSSSQRNGNAQAKNARGGKNAKSSQSQASLMQFFRPVRGKLIAAIALQIIASLFSVMPYIALLWLADAMAVPARPDGHTAWNAVMLYLIAVSVESLIAALGMLLTHIADIDLQARTRINLADTLGRVPLGWFDANGAGRVRKALNDDVESLHHLVSHSVLDIISAVVTPLVGVVFCFVMDWRMGLIALIPAVLYMATFSLMSPRDNRGVMDEIAASLAAVSEAIVDYVGGVAVLKIFGRAKEGSWRFSKTSNAFISDFARLVGPQMHAQAVALIWLSAPVVTLMVALGGVIFVGQGSIEPAKALVVALVALSLPGALITLASGNQAYSEGREAVERITGLLNEPPLPQPSKPLRPANRTVEFDDVHFSYPQVDGADGAGEDGNSSASEDAATTNGSDASDTSEPANEAVAGVSFTVPEGGTVALVGPSGAGKSTLALLLARFHDVDAGSIRIGGVDVRQMTEPVLRANVGLVLQQVQLPSLSLKENIALGTFQRLDGRYHRRRQSCAYPRAHHGAAMRLRFGYRRGCAALGRRGAACVDCARDSAKHADSHHGRGDFGRRPGNRDGDSKRAVGSGGRPHGCHHRASLANRSACGQYSGHRPWPHHPVRHARAARQCARSVRRYVAGTAK